MGFKKQKNLHFRSGDFFVLFPIGKMFIPVPTITNSYQEFLLLSGNANFVRVHMTMNIIIASCSNMKTSFKGRLRIFIAFFIYWMMLFFRSLLFAFSGSPQNIQLAHHLPGSLFHVRGHRNLPLSAV